MALNRGQPLSGPMTTHFIAHKCSTEPQSVNFKTVFEIVLVYRSFVSINGVWCSVSLSWLKQLYGNGSLAGVFPLRKVKLTWYYHHGNRSEAGFTWQNTAWNVYSKLQVRRGRISSYTETEMHWYWHFSSFLHHKFSFWHPSAQSRVSVPVYNSMPLLLSQWFDIILAYKDTHVWLHQLALVPGLLCM